jgi:hypothetical protein
MTWFGWVLVAFTIAGLLMSAFMIGEPRQPITAGAFALQLAISLALLAGILLIGTGKLR